MFSFGARINGKTYYLRFIISLLALLAFAWILELIVRAEQDLEGIAGMAFVFAAIVFLLFWVCLIRQRSNDISKDHPLLLAALAAWTPVWLILGFFPNYEKRQQ